MGIIKTSNTEVLKFQGLHLYHGGLSNCSMRVRMTLEEKGLKWTSHHIDLMKREQITPEYFSINPKGLVPALVDYGIVMVESDFIIDYLDKKFLAPSLRPESEQDIKRMYYWLALASDIHMKAVKTCVYAKKLRGKITQSKKIQREFTQLQTDKKLLEFHRKSNGEGFSDAEVTVAMAILDDCFNEMEKSLQGHEWMVGDQFSLADITWVPLYFTLKELIEYSFEDFPNILSWAERLESRPSYKKAVLDWWPKIKN